MVPKTDLHFEWKLGGKKFADYVATASMILYSVVSYISGTKCCIAVNGIEAALIADSNGRII